MKRDPKGTYAQSSDIKSRTFLEYRRDMKKKAIAELEIIEYLASKLREQYKTKRVTVLKSGGDKFLWFLRKGGITRESDFVAKVNDQETEIEFQYGKKQDLPFNDFKVSKVARKNRATGEREPLTNKKFFCVNWSLPGYALIEPKWIFENGEYGMVPAWRSYAFRVPSAKFDEILIKDDALRPVCDIIDEKNLILEFQHKQIDVNKDRLSKLLQMVIDEEKLVQIIPKDLDSFFKVCFILDNIERIPDNANLWIIYLLTYIQKDLSLEELSRIVYCLDFLYSKVELKGNELGPVVQAVQNLMSMVKNHAGEGGRYASSARYSPLEETRFALFSINLLEDLTQDLIYYYPVKDLKPIDKIYDNVRDTHQTAEFIRKNS